VAKIAVIVGSVRSERQGIKVGNWVVKKLKDRGYTVTLVDPLKLQFPLLDKMYKEMGTPAIPSQLPISKIQDVFGENGELLDKNYDQRSDRFFDEFEWYVNSFLEQRKKGTPC
jgi:NAD(P)H-dependent FMN reductase